MNLKNQYCIVDMEIPDHIYRTIYYAYIHPLHQLSENFGVNFSPSARSCYRPYAYEIRRGRSGGSLHTFPTGTLGACDLITSKGRITETDLDILKLHSPFKRICHYPKNGFVHVDYGMPGMPVHRREFYTCNSPSGKWAFVGDLCDNREKWNLHYTRIELHLHDGTKA
jgi:hypothetical protein